MLRYYNSISSNALQMKMKVGIVLIILLLIPFFIKKRRGLQESPMNGILSFSRLITIIFRNIDYLSIILFEVNHAFSVLATNLFLWIRHLVFRLECRRR